MTWSMILMIFLAESAVGIYQYVFSGHPVRQVGSLEYKTRDAWLTHWHKPLVNMKISSVQGEMNIVQDVSYTFDEKGRRTSVPENKSGDRHALFFGGSFTFGSGVSDDQTLPSNFNLVSNNEFRSYNYGGGGFGPGAMFIQLDREELCDDIEPYRGIAVFSFIAPHLTRNTAYNLDYFRFTYKNPIFYIDSYHDKLIGPKKYYEIPSLDRVFYFYRNFWKHSYLFRFVSYRIQPKFISEKEATEIIAKIIIESKNKYQSRFEGTYYTLMWPRMNDELRQENKQLLKKILNDQSIQVIEIPPMANENLAILHPLDRHPSAAEYRWVADHLYQEVKRRL